MNITKLKPQNLSAVTLLWILLTPYGQKCVDTMWTSIYLLTLLRWLWARTGHLTSVLDLADGRVWMGESPCSKAQTPVQSQTPQEWRPLEQWINAHGCPAMLMMPNNHLCDVWVWAYLWPCSVSYITISGVTLLCNLCCIVGFIPYIVSSPHSWF